MELYENAQFKVGWIIITGRVPKRKSLLIIIWDLSQTVLAKLNPNGKTLDNSVSITVFYILLHFDKRENPLSSRQKQMLNSSSQKARIIFYFSRDGTEWVCDQENISIHFDAGAPGDVIVEVTLAAGALYPRVRHSCHTAHNLNYLL